MRLTAVLNYKVLYGMIQEWNLVESEDRISVVKDDVNP